MRTISRRSLALGVAGILASAVLAPSKLRAQAQQDASQPVDATTSQQVITAARHWVHLVNAKDASVIDLTSPDMWPYYFYSTSTNQDEARTQSANNITGGTIPTIVIYDTSNVRSNTDPNGNAYFSVDVTYSGGFTKESYFTEEWDFAPNDNGTLIFVNSKALQPQKIKGHTYIDVNVVLSENGVQIGKQIVSGAGAVVLFTEKNDTSGVVSGTLYPLPTGISPTDEWNKIIQDFLPDNVTQGTRYLVAAPVKPGAVRVLGAVLQPGQYILTLWSIDDQNNPHPMQGDQYVAPFTVK